MFQTGGYELELRPSPTGAKAEAKAGGDAQVVLRRRSMTGHEVVPPGDPAQVLAQTEFHAAAQSRREGVVANAGGNPQRRDRIVTYGPTSKPGTALHVFVLSFISPAE